MATDCHSVIVKDVQGIGAYARRWRAYCRSCPGLFLNMPDFDILLVRHATEVQYVRRMHKMMRTDISLNKDVVDLSRCRLPRPFR